MLTLKLTIGFFLTVLVSSTAYSQGCANSLKYKITKMTDSDSNQIYSMSRSAYKEIEVHKTYKFKVVFYGRKKYFLGIVTETAYEPVHIRLIDTKNNNVLFDNEEGKYIGFVVFYQEKTQTITVEITLIASDELNTLPADQLVCLGIKIMSKSIE